MSFSWLWLGCVVEGTPRQTDKEVAEADADHDGFEAPEDCDDADANVRPDANEWCNEVDDDCDGAVDEDALKVGYVDQDGDGFGTEEIWSCDTTGLALAAGDCDDAAAAIFPGAVEVCNGLDDDCDGTHDDGAPDEIWYVDADGDGFGAGEAITACDPGAGSWAHEGGDCDEANDAVNPGAEEICTDGIDNDCDLTIDVPCIGSELPLDKADVVLMGNEAGGWAAHFAPAGDVNGDGELDLWVGAPDAMESAGQVYLRAGPLASGGLMFDALAIVTGEVATAHLGERMVALGDIDGDGYDDGALTAPEWNTLGFVREGALYFVYGPGPGIADATELDRVLGAEDYGRFGQGLDAADADGDGARDLIVGAPYEQDGQGAVYVGTPDGFTGVGSVSYATLSAVIRDTSGSEYGSGFGFDLDATQDVDGDGVSDLVVGAPHDVGVGTGTTPGTASLFLGPIEGDLTQADAIATWTGPDWSYFGMTVALLPDTNGDGYGEVSAGAPYDSWTEAWGGSAYLFDGGAASGLATDEALAIVQGDDFWGDLGSDVSAGGDLDGDGLSEWMVGADSATTHVDHDGAAYVFLGPVSGTLAPADADLPMTGVDTESWTGTRVGSADLDQDGKGDLLVGSGLAGGTGAVYVQYGW